LQHSFLVKSLPEQTGKQFYMIKLKIVAADKRSDGRESVMKLWARQAVYYIIIRFADISRAQRCEKTPSGEEKANPSSL